MITCTIVDAAVVQDDNATPINGVPGFHSDNKGLFQGKYPYSVASKALTSLYKHLLKYKTEWFPWYDTDNPPHILLVIENRDTGKKYAYLGHRETAPQSRNGPRVIPGANGRKRVYKWVNKLARVSLEEVGWAD
jgi:hypothetical protein